MQTLYYLGYFGVIVWAIIPFRQYKNKYFIYFLTWVCADLFALAARFIFHSGTNVFFAPLSFLALVSLLNFETTKKYLWAVIILFILSIMLSLKDNLWVMTVILIHLFILGFFLKDIIVSLNKNYIINIFVLLLAFYEITVVAKNINYLTGFTNDYYYYIITNIFEIIFGLFFIIFKADDGRLILRFK